MGSSYSSNRTGETKIDTLNSREIETDPKIAMATTETDPAVTEEMIDWSNLPSDIVDLVAERVATNLADYMNLLAIFPLWRPVTVDPRHLKFPPQLPWLLLTDTNANPLPFISISDVEPRSLPLPEATGKKILFSSDGWLVMEGSPTKISLLNPLTRRLIHLPPLPPCEDTYDRAMRMLAIAMSSVPTSSLANSSIMAIIGQPTVSETPTMLIGLQSGSRAWIIVNKTNTFEDVIYHKDCFYAVTSWARVLVFNAEFMEVMGVEISWYSYWSPWRLVESSGELLMVKRNLTESGITTWFEFYRLSSLEGSLRFTKLQGVDVGDQMIFLGNYGRAVSLPAKDHPPLKGNRIYCSAVNIWKNCKNLKFDAKALKLRPVYTISIEAGCWASFGGTETWHMPKFC